MKRLNSWIVLAFRGLGAICILFGQANAANQLDALVKDFAPIDGYVVTVMGEDYLIDLDGDAGIQSGDYFAVLEPGEAITHPISKKEIGRLDKIKNFLKVARIADGYSHAYALQPSPRLKRGEPIRRYYGVPVYFWDLTGHGKGLWRALQHRLPELNWKDYLLVEKGQVNQGQQLSSDSAGLHIIFARDNVKVYTAEQLLLHEYDMAINRGDSAGPAVPEIVLSRPGMRGPPSAPVMAARKNSGQTSVHFQSMKDFSAQPLGHFPGVTKMADFVQVGNDGLVAATDGTTIQIFKLTTQLEFVAKKKMAGAGQILALKWWQTSKSNSPYLAAVMWRDDGLKSTVYAFKNNQLEPEFVRLRAILGAFDFDGDMRPETLLSQQFESDSFFGHRIHQLHWNNGVLKVQRFKTTLPLNFTVTGSQFADLTQDSQLEAIYIRNGVLNISSGNKSLYHSTKQMGGTLSVLTYEKDASFKDYISASAFFEIAPIAFDIDNDGQMELVAVSSDQSGMRAPGVSVHIKDTSLVAFNYEGGRFVKKTLVHQVDQPVQGLGVHNNHLVYLISEPAPGSNSSGESRLFKLR